MRMLNHYSAARLEMEVKAITVAFGVGMKEERALNECVLWCQDDVEYSTYKTHLQCSKHPSQDSIVLLISKAGNYRYFDLS
jgi:hypothetical protein